MLRRFVDRGREPATSPRLQELVPEVTTAIGKFQAARDRPDRPARRRRTRTGRAAAQRSRRAFSERLAPTIAAVASRAPQKTP